MKRRYFLLSLVWILCAAKPSGASAVDTIKVLFIGNSLTYTNDLPALVEELGRLDGRIITTHSISLPDYSLEDHWNGGNAEAEIEKGIYDFVILQQGPSALPESQVLLLDYASRFAIICKEHHARPALYMVWPFKSRLFDLDNVITSYSNAATKTGSLLCPAGLAWKYAWKADPSIRLYGPDNFHPGMDGSLLAALTIYAVLADKKQLESILYDKIPWKDQLNETRFNLLKAAALAAIK